VPAPAPRTAAVAVRPTRPLAAVSKCLRRSELGCVASMSSGRTRSRRAARRASRPARRGPGSRTEHACGSLWAWTYPLLILRIRVPGYGDDVRRIARRSIEHFDCTRHEAQEVDLWADLMGSSRPP